MSFPAITFRMNVRNVAKRLLKDKQKIEDLKPYWTFIWEAFVIDWLHEIFKTEGYGKWPRTKYTSDPILQRTRRMFRSYTRRRTTGNINIQKGHYFEFGSSVPYARLHETGTKIGGRWRMPPRPVVGLLYERLAGRQGEQQLQDSFEAYFIAEDESVSGAERFVRRRFSRRRLRFLGG